MPLRGPPRKQGSPGNDEIGKIAFKGQGADIGPDWGDPVFQAGLPDVVTGDGMAVGGLVHGMDQQVRHLCQADGQRGRAGPQIDAGPCGDAVDGCDLFGHDRIDGSKHGLGDIVHHPGGFPVILVIGIGVVRQAFDMGVSCNFWLT